jgi:rRNA small subunit pseudouridine methyltransferase Nep1
MSTRVRRRQSISADADSDAEVDAVMRPHSTPPAPAPGVMAAAAAPVELEEARPTRPLPRSALDPRVAPFTPGIVPNPRMLPAQASAGGGQRKLYVVLAQACLESYRVSAPGAKGRDGGAKYALLNCDDHQGVLAKMGRDIADARPDITHQCLLTLLDSPLNKAGRLQVFVSTTKGVLIELNPHVRIPRTFKRFSGLIVQLLHKLAIRGAAGPEKLLRVVKNPVSAHLPPDTTVLALSGDAPLVRLRPFLGGLPQDKHIAIFVGAMARGKDDFADGIASEKIAVSAYPLSASVACGKVCPILTFPSMYADIGTVLLRARGPLGYRLIPSHPIPAPPETLIRLALPHLRPAMSPRIQPALATKTCSCTPSSAPRPHAPYTYTLLCVNRTRRFQLLPFPSLSSSSSRAPVAHDHRS